MKAEIEGITFYSHHFGAGHYQAPILCKDGTRISVIQCDGSGSLCLSLSGWPTANRGCFYGNIEGEERFEVWDYSIEGGEPIGYQTAQDVIRVILEHGGLEGYYDVAQLAPI